MKKDWWKYENLESRWPYDWGQTNKSENPDDHLDFHIDLGGGRIPKARLNLDIGSEADIQINLNTMELIESVGPLTQIGKSLPFPDESIFSIISHHCLEHIGEGFIRLMDECYRVLMFGGVFRIIVPLFPCNLAVSDPDHKRYFTKDSFHSFVHDAGPEVPFWSESFSQPYTKARFKLSHLEYTPALNNEELAVEMKKPMKDLTIDDHWEYGRELRVTLTK